MNSPRADRTPSESLPAGSGVGSVRLAVTDRERALRFYRDILGLELIDDGPTLGLGAGGRVLVVLQPGAADDVADGVTGLYHFAIVLPHLRDFARVVKRLTEIGHPHSPTDHCLTKSDYLWDPDGNGIEIYAETPEDGTFLITEDEFSARDAAGHPRSGRDPIRLGELFSQLEPGDDLFLPLPAQSRMGHIHLHVRDVEEAVRFYRDLIGFDVMGMSRRFGVAFVSAGGYHHHVGLNSWAGRGAPTPPPDRAGLREFTIEVPREADLDQVITRLHKAGIAPRDSSRGGFIVSDPSGNRAAVRTAGHR